MRVLKNTFAVLLSVCLAFCLVGCGEGDEYDDFDPVGVCVVESIGGAQYETLIDDEDTVKKLWNKLDSIVVDAEPEAEMGSAYLYMCFYNESQSTLGVFTIYDNGACCLGEDFTSFYNVTDGREVYLELCDIYTSYEAE